MITGTNKMFHAVWDCDQQRYSIYKDNKFLIFAYNMKTVENYIN